MQTLIHTLALVLLEIASAIGLFAGGRLVLRPLGPRLSAAQLNLYQRAIGTLMAAPTLVVLYLA